MRRPYRLAVAADTHTGQLRTRNEDYFSVGQRAELLLVADGVGSRPGGDVAATLAVETVRNFFDHPPAAWSMDPAQAVAEAIALANRCIRERASAVERLRGMGTTLAVVLGLAEHVWIGHVGDARVYRLRDQMFECLTIDHNVGSDPRAGEWFGIAALARADPQALTRALGSREKIEPDVRREELRAGDVLLLATDGLTKMLDDAEIADVLLEHADACTAVARLIERANDRGGYDNITVIVGRCTTD